MRVPVNRPIHPPRLITALLSQLTLVAIAPRVAQVAEAGALAKRRRLATCKRGRGKGGAANGRAVGGNSTASQQLGRGACTCAAVVLTPRAGKNSSSPAPRETTTHHWWQPVRCSGMRCGRSRAAAPQTPWPTCQAEGAVQACRQHSTRVLLRMHDFRPKQLHNSRPSASNSACFKPLTLSGKAAGSRQQPQQRTRGCAS